MYTLHVQFHTMLCNNNVLLGLPSQLPLKIPLHVITHFICVVKENTTSLYGVEICYPE